MVENSPHKEVNDTINNATGVEQSLHQAGEDTLKQAEEQSLEQARITTLEAELAQVRDQLLRSAAEAQNMRRRSEQEMEKTRKFALEKMVGNLLPVVDSLEKALASFTDGNGQDPHREGVQITLNLLLDVLKKANVEILDPINEPFDPRLHEAMAMVPNPDVEPNTVIEVLQKGYRLNQDRLVRPAMVVVSQNN